MLQPTPHPSLTSKMAQIPLGEDPNRPVRLYADGAFDLFHFGHARLLEQCKKKFKYVHLIVGVSSQSDIISFKGKPIMTEYERGESVRHCKWADEVICPCPWVTTLEFVREHEIDYVCHDEAPYMAGGGGGDVYGHLKTAGKFLATQRTEGISTSDLVMRLIKDYDEYVLRNLTRGYSRQDLNVSLLRASQIQLNSQISQLKATFSTCKSYLTRSFPEEPEDFQEETGNLDQNPSHLEAKMDIFRSTLRVVAEALGKTGISLACTFANSFDRKSKAVETIMKRAFRFKSLDECD